jgi:hypothetical protein
MGILHRDCAPSLGPVERPDPDDGSREELAAFYAECDTLCRSCRNDRCPVEDRSNVLSCCEYKPTEAICPTPPNGLMTTGPESSTIKTS